jgi:predicted TIM-barrel fold metal-dependent hydrolase
VQNKIALEEHFGSPEFEVVPPITEPELKERIEEWGEVRLGEMDENGIELMLLSLTSPGAQAEADPGRAQDVAQRSNDLLAEIVAARPDRYAGFAAVSMHDAAVAADELQRGVNELGCKGAMLNGYQSVGDGSDGLYYDDRRFDPFWERVVALGIPVYLHPRAALPDQLRHYEQYPEIVSAAWGFGVETGTHAIRMILSGLFDRYPKLQVGLGHLGETLPFAIWRLEHRIALRPHGRKLERRISDYLRDNFFVTTSGNFSTTALRATIDELGAERVLFAVDYPYESIREGCEWFDSVPLDEAERELIGRANAQRLLKLR